MTSRAPGVRAPDEEVLTGLLSASPDALLAVDASGRIVFVNDQAERLFDWTRDDLVGQPIETLVPDRFRDGHPRLRGGYTAHPTTRPMGAGLELRAKRRDGSEFPAEISLSAVTTPKGTIVAAAIRDVTISRRMEQRFRALLSSAPDAIVGVDATGRIELLNEQAERLFGWRGDELIGQQVECLVPISALGAHVAHRASYVVDPRPRPMGADLQLSARRKDGSTFPAEISLSGVVDELGTLLVLAAVRDVTDRIELEAERRRQALEAQREQSHRLESLGQLAGGVAHDFNNLLGVIANYATLLSRRVNDPQAKSDVAEIAAAADRAAGLTRQLLTFARRDVANPEPIDVNGTIREVASMLDRTLGEHIAMELDLVDGQLVAVADRHQLAQVVLNLAINARDAMSTGGRLRIETATLDADADRAPGPVGPALVVRVVDTGEGMERDVVERAFEPFFSTKPRGQGTGLGLATVYGIVSQQGGSVVIDSAPGEGTTVSVVLPRVSDPPIAPEVPVATERGQGRILLVEDDESLRHSTAQILREQGYVVIVAVDGIDALETFEREVGRIDVVVSDVAMPRMSGDELAVRLAELAPSVPVVLMSGYDSGDGPYAGRMLAKPVSEETLLRAIREERHDGPR